MLPIGQSVRIFHDGQVKNAVVREHDAYPQARIFELAGGAKLSTADYNDKLDTWYTDSDDGDECYIALHVIQNKDVFPLPDADAIRQAFKLHVKKLTDLVIDKEMDASDLGYLLKIIGNPAYFYNDWVNCGRDYDKAADEIVRKLFLN